MARNPTIPRAVEVALAVDGGVQLGVEIRVASADLADAVTAQTVDLLDVLLLAQIHLKAARAA